MRILALHRKALHLQTGKWWPISHAGCLQCLRVSGLDYGSVSGQA